MEAKNKNILIGGLLAIVLVMAVGYAAFATQLNINGTANITSSWHVGFDTSKTSGSDVIAPTTGLSGATAPSGSVSYGDDQHATINAKLNQPGDQVKFTLTILNTGSLDANLNTPVVSMSGGEVQGLVATKGNIRFTVTQANPTLLQATSGTATMTVTAEFIDKEIASSTQESASIDVVINATQA